MHAVLRTLQLGSLIPIFTMNVNFFQHNLWGWADPDVQQGLNAIEGGLVNAGIATAAAAAVIYGVPEIVRHMAAKRAEAQVADAPDYNPPPEQNM